jgi:hypothetical protein
VRSSVKRASLSVLEARYKSAGDEYAANDGKSPETCFRALSKGVRRHEGAFDERLHRG